LQSTKILAGNKGQIMMDGSIGGPRMVLQLINGDAIALIFFSRIYFTLLDDNSGGAENDALLLHERGLAGNKGWNISLL